MATNNYRSDLGPLTTTFTPPADCTSLQYLNAGAAGLNISPGNWCYTASSLNGPDPDSTSVIKSCFPEGYASFYNRYWNSNGYIGVYSPASVCPSGHTVACAQTRSKGQSNPFQDRPGFFADGIIWDLLREGETASGCCPVGYGCDQVVASMCTSDMSRSIEMTITTKCPGKPASTGPADAEYALAMRVLMVQAAATPEHTATRTATSAPASSAPASSAPASSAPTSSAPTSSAPASSGLSENTLSTPSQGLPLAAKIAIGVVIPLVVILAGAACFFIYRYRRKRRLLQAAQGLGQDARGNGGDDLETPKPELPGDDGMARAGPNGTAFRKAELDATMVGWGGVVELPAELAGGGFSELHGGSSPGELDSMSKGFSVIDVAGQDVNNQHVDERSKGLWQWSSYQD